MLHRSSLKLCIPVVLVWPDAGLVRWGGLLGNIWNNGLGTIDPQLSTGNFWALLLRWSGWHVLRFRLWLHNKSRR
ncbi:hypothetical protein BGX38DRAFT_1202323 [Terfezia claveryi]|nr:hypothetical protein BGX38DRAFT_1242187 [Terfezia claveryi]KAF8442545.1 hypothetical protein BGX38DRAFT_1202323 [Terfezia claveryi]